MIPPRKKLVHTGFSALLAVVIVVLIVVSEPPTAAFGSTGCGFVRSHEARVHARVLRGEVNCRRARRVLREYLNSEHACGGSSCVRRHRGFTCQTAPSAAFPRLASCYRGRARIAAYSAAD